MRRKSLSSFNIWTVYLTISLRKGSDIRVGSGRFRLEVFCSCFVASEFSDWCCIELLWSLRHHDCKGFLYRPFCSCSLPSSVVSVVVNSLSAVECIIMV